MLLLLPLALLVALELPLLPLLHLREDEQHPQAQFGPHQIAQATAMMAITKIVNATPMKNHQAALHPLTPSVAMFARVRMS